LNNTNKPGESYLRKYKIFFLYRNQVPSISPGGVYCFLILFFSLLSISDTIAIIVNEMLKAKTGMLNVNGQTINKYIEDPHIKKFKIALNKTSDFNQLPQ
jgi:mannose/fructose/N-acetylgalactosamine-specific phosphotransferase system component IIC